MYDFYWSLQHQPGKDIISTSEEVVWINAFKDKLQLFYSACKFVLIERGRRSIQGWKDDKIMLKQV